MAGKDSAIVLDQSHTSHVKIILKNLPL